MARLAGALWSLEGNSYAVQPVGGQRRVFQHLAGEADNEYAMIDSTIVQAHQHSEGAQKEGETQALGRSKGGLSTNIHTTVDVLGNPTGFLLTPR